MIKLNEIYIWVKCVLNVGVIQWHLFICPKKKVITKDGEVTNWYNMAYAWEAPMLRSSLKNIHMKFNKDIIMFGKGMNKDQISCTLISYEH